MEGKLPITVTQVKAPFREELKALNVNFSTKFRIKKTTTSKVFRKAFISILCRMFIFKLCFKVFVELMERLVRKTPSK